MPVTSSVCLASTTASSASSRRSARSVRQSLANSVAARGTFDGKVFQLRFEPLQQGEGIGRRAGKAGDHFAFRQAADFHGVGLHHGRAQRHLAVAADGHFALVPHRKNGCRANFHVHLPRQEKKREFDSPVWRKKHSPARGGGCDV